MYYRFCYPYFVCSVPFYEIFIHFFPSLRSSKTVVKQKIVAAKSNDKFKKGQVRYCCQAVLPWQINRILINAVPPVDGKVAE